MSEAIHFSKHNLEWTPEKISRFWDFESQCAEKRTEYFTQKLGGALIRLARMNHALAEPALDYGAGVGFLTERLVEAGVQAAACDYSPASVESINERLAGHSNFLKCTQMETLPSALPAEYFGTVFLVETLEHLLPEWRRNTLQEIARILKPGGQVVVTVPHAEPLAASQVLCADCGAVFHRVQHVASFNAESLSALMAGHGFKQIMCQPISLALLTDQLQQAWPRFRRGARHLLERAKLLPVRAEPTPNLVYIGHKE
jgi:SAM-dependent methyltransferase